jgi:hypothetical protein
LVDYEGLLNVFLENELIVDGRWDDELVDEVISSPLSDANGVVDWLKMNQPRSENEIDDLVRLIVEFKIDDDVSIGDYGIREVYGQRMIFGPCNMLYVQGDELIGYLLGLLDGLKDELSSIEEDDDVGWDA